MPIRSRAQSASWLRLAAELRVMILELLRDMLDKEPLNTFENKERSSYASTCWEWQYFFEKQNFENLVLHQADIGDFGRIVQGARKAYVRWIWLRLELPEYDCSRCLTPESPAEERDHKLLFTDAVWELFTILSTWKISEVSGRHGVKLEFSVHSPSDLDNICKELKNRINDTGWGGTIIRPHPKKRHRARMHGWSYDTQHRHTTDGAKLRVFGHPKGLGFDLRLRAARQTNGVLPDVKVITSLIIRRQFYRYFSIPKALQPIIKSLTSLRAFKYEPWRGINTNGIAGRSIRDEQHRILISEVLNLKQGLRSVSIFEDVQNSFYWRPKVRPRPMLGQDLAKSSQHLEALHAALNVDAADFFFAFWPEQDPKLASEFEWKKLKHLSLTSKLLQPFYCDLLIQAAAGAARRMPKLQMMELWDTTRSSSCIFRYMVKDDIPRIQLFSTWNGFISARAADSWRQVVYGCRFELRVESKPFIKAKSLASILPQLALRNRMLTDASYRQIVSRG